jgi:hypothetical protein
MAWASGFGSDVSIGRVAIVAAATAAAIIPTPPDLVERVYSTGAYPLLQRATTALSNLAPFALFDALLVVVLGGWMALALIDLRRGSGRFRAAWKISGRTIVWAAALYLLFLSAWGLNYRRTPLAVKLRLDATAVTPDAARTLATTAVDQLNVLHPQAHAAEWPDAGGIDPVLVRALASADQQLGGAGTVVAGRPKGTVLDWYFRRTATDGMTDPYFLETLVSSSLLPFERPFVLAHEWSHLAGVADEGDANFLAWLACVHASPPSQYSGWLFLFAEVAASLDAPARAEVVAKLGPGPRADLVAIRMRVEQQVSPQLAALGRLVYDRYLKANRVESGVRSYGHVVQLVLGARFDAGWNPRR